MPGEPKNRPKAISVYDAWGRRPRRKAPNAAGPAAADEMPRVSEFGPQGVPNNPLARVLASRRSPALPE